MTKNLEKFNAFTLAEVLITLGIIGVVAAMTMPTLVQNYKKHVVETKLQKFYSLMGQAIKMSEASNGEITSWDKKTIKFLEDGTKDWDANATDTEEFFNKYIAPHVKVIKTDKREFIFSGNSITLTTVYLSDGTVIGLNNGSCMDFTFDINGNQAPNIAGQDLFGFLLCTDKNNTKVYCRAENIHFCTYGNKGTRDQRILNCQTDGRKCSSLIEFDGWKIKDDYPYKL